MNKLLPPFVMPIVIGPVLVLVGIVMRRRWVAVAGVALLWLASTPLIAHAMLRVIEGGQVRVHEAEAPSADMIVVLSPGRHLAPGPAQISEWRDANRFFAGVELWLAGKAPRLVFTDASPASGGPNHGAILQRYAAQLGVEASAVDVVGPVATTEDEADVLACALAEGALDGAAVGTPRILLVTSASHMPRAVNVFERRGFDVLAFPVDFKRSAARALHLMDLVPTSSALRNTELAWRELIGRGWERTAGQARAPACLLN